MSFVSETTEIEPVILLEELENDTNAKFGGCERSAFFPKSSWEPPSGHANLEVVLS